jgi:inositol phosphorylceramide synthase regulatory subunit
LDTLVNSVYTTLFGLGWFLVLARELGQPPVSFEGDVNVPGAGTIDETSGFTSPEVNATKVDVVAHPAPGILDGQKAIAYGSQYGNLGVAVFQSGSMASLTVLGLLWIARTYFCILIMSHSRSMLRGYVASTSTEYSHADDPNLAENPFRVGREEGAGWRGKLGRFMLRFPTKRYWLGKDEDEDEWVRATSGRFESGRGNGLRIKVPENGVGERERRARSGTGPPLPVAIKGKA